MIRLFFGVPGCGKTTSAVRELYKMQSLPFYKKVLNFFIKIINKIFKKELFKLFVKKPLYDYYFSNYENNLSKFVNLNDLGLWTFPEYSYISIDEASIQYNNRKFKTLPQHTIEWYKLHRHFKVDCDIFSQSWDDVDITLRRLVNEIWYVKKIGPFTMLRRVYKKIEIDENSHQIIDGYRFDKLLMSLFLKLIGVVSLKIYFRPKYYKYFDSWTRPNLPIKYGGNTNV